MQLLRTNKVVKLTGLSRTTIWRLQREGSFPQRLQLGRNSVGWLEQDIDEWINSRARTGFLALPKDKLLSQSSSDV